MSKLLILLLMFVFTIRLKFTNEITGWSFLSKISKNYLISISCRE
jgi:hypothetical protein